MKFFLNTGSRIAQMRKRLTRISESEPLSKLSLLVLIFLDIFVAVTIFTGLEDHTRQLATVDQYIPYYCQDFVTDADKKTVDQKIISLGQMLNTGFDEYTLVKDYLSYKEEDIHPICWQLRLKINAANSNSDFLDLYRTRADLERAINQIHTTLNDIKGNYDTAVLEKIANMSSDAQNIQNNRNQKTQELKKLENEFSQVNSKIMDSDEYKMIWGYILDNRSQKQNELENALMLANFWFPIKKLLMELVFLVPIFLVFWFWNGTSIKNARGMQSIISSHLLVVSFIPIFIKIIEAIFDIIPKRLLENLLAFLASWRLLAIWYYILVFLGVMAAILVVYLIQKKIFNKTRLYERRLSNGECYNCGKKVPESARYCPFCSAHQYKMCHVCGKETHFAGRYCEVCSADLGFEE